MTFAAVQSGWAYEPLRRADVSFHVGSILAGGDAVRYCGGDYVE